MNAVVKMKDMLLSEIEKRNDLANRVFPLVGEFDCSNMTASGVARYACSKLGVKAPETQSRMAILAFLDGYERARRDVLKALNVSAVGAARSN